MPNAMVNSDSTNQLSVSIEELQSWWEVPSIAHFCSLFREAFSLLEFSIEDLEEALINVGNDTFTGPSPLVLQLLIILLRGSLNRKDINLSNYDDHLKEFFYTKYYEINKKPQHWDSSATFLVMPLRTKVLILNELCQFRLEALDVIDTIKNWESDNLRLEPIGTDGSGKLYWYFYGTRLYQEFVPKKIPEPKPTQRRTKKRGARKKQKGRKLRGKNEAKKEKDEIENDGIAQWSVVCDTEQEWQQLAEKFAKSTIQCEKLLRKRLVDDFLPEIGKLFIEKEKVFKKKLLEMAPKRVSQRIEKFKQQEIEKEVERVQEEEKLQEELKARRIEEEEKRKFREIKEREKRALERMQMKEDRARRANRRREYGDYIPELAPEPVHVYTSSGRVSHKPSMTHGTRGSTSYFETTDAQRMFKVLQSIQKHRDAWPFRDPITERYAPGYFTVIENPMDLSSIGKKLQNGLYNSPTEFENDFTLMFDNCRRYNGATSEYTQMGETVRNVFKSIMKDAFPLRNEAPNLQLPDEYKRIFKIAPRNKFATNGDLMTNSTVTTVKQEQVRLSAPTATVVGLAKEIKTVASKDTIKTIPNILANAKTSLFSSVAKPIFTWDKSPATTTSQATKSQPAPFKLIPVNSLKSLNNKTEPAKLAGSVIVNGSHSKLQTQSGNSSFKYVVLTSKGTSTTTTPTTTASTATPLSKMTVIQIGKDKKLIINRDRVLGSAANPTAIQANGPKLNGVSVKRVIKLLNNGSLIQGSKRVNETVLGETSNKRIAEEAASTPNNVLQTTPPTSIVTETSQLRVNHAPVIDPSHASYCIQVPTVTNCTRQPILTVAPPEGQQYEISNGSTLETIIQPTYIQTQVQTQPVQYNYIDIGQLQQPQQQQLVIPVNNQILYTTSDMVTTNVGSMLQVYPNVMFQLASPVQQQQMIPVQYYEAVTSGGIS